MPPAVGVLLRVRSSLLDLLGGPERKNGWSRAEFAGHATPGGTQRLLNHARWEADATGGAPRSQTAERIGSPTVAP